jgi:hypothetical protein
MPLNQKAGIQKAISWTGPGMQFWGWLAGRLTRLRQIFEQHEKRARNLRISCESPTPR